VTQPLDTLLRVIAPNRGGLRIGPAKLIVDGSDETLCRKAQFSLAPGRSKCRRLEQLVSLSREVYNAALEARGGAWRTEQRSVKKFEEFGEIAELRRVRPDIVPFGNQPVRGALSRLDEAFGAFFRRVKASESPGYPRFKSKARFRTVFYDEPVSWALRGLHSGPPRLYVQGVGEIALSKRGTRQLRRLVERGGEPRTLTITKTKSGAWRATVGFRGVLVALQPTNDQVGAVDRGIAVTAALPDGTHFTAPGFLKIARRTIGALQHERSGHKVGSSEWRRFNTEIAKVYGKAQHQSENWARHAAIDIVARYGVIALEDLKLVNMSKSAKGTIANPGKGVKAKSALNRSLAEAALGRLAYWICVKAEEAGRRVYTVNPANSSRECAACGHVAKENRWGSRFTCGRCGHSAHADTNAAQVLTARGEAADVLWRHGGCPLLTRPVPRKQRRNADAQMADPRTSHGPGRLVTQHSPNTANRLAADP
jgi:putative transposase